MTGEQTWGTIGFEAESQDWECFIGRIVIESSSMIHQKSKTCGEAIKHLFSELLILYSRGLGGPTEGCFV
jgi:hypothetical protein